MKAGKVAVVLLLLAAPVSAQLASAPSAAPPAAPAVQYTVSLDDPTHHILHVRMEFRPAPDSKVQMPVWNALYQVRDFSQYIIWLKAVDAAGGAVSTRMLDKTTWEVPSAHEVEYEVYADQPGPFGAQLSAEHAFFNLAEILMYPVGQQGGAMSVRFTSLPAGWKIATAMPAAGQPNTFAARNYDHMVDSPVEIGAFREADFNQGGAHYRVIVDSPLDVDIKAIAEIDRKLAAAETDWMQDRPFDQYTFIYHFPRRPAGGGMEHAYSTAIDAGGERVEQDPGAITDITAHEFFHLWNVKRIRPQSLEPVDYTQEQYTRALWFSEGVTSAVAAHMSVRAGLADDQHYLQGISRAINTLESRPAHRTQSAEESSLETWFDKYPYYGQPDRSISYYVKGELLGVLLDLAVRDATQGKKSLRDVFLWMKDNYAKKGKFFPDSAGVEQAAEAVSGANFKEFFTRYVAGLDALPYDRYFATVGLKLEQQAATVPDAGFRLARRTGTVESVEPDSAAEKAGVKEGDTVLELNGKAPAGPWEAQLARMHVGDSVRLKLQGPAGTREVTFVLSGRATINYALVELQGATPEQRARRSAWVRGDSQP